MENAPPPAEELVILDRELGHIEARRAQLLARRAWLLSVMQQAVAPQTPFSPPAPAFGAGHAPQTPRAPRDASPRSAQNVLLTLGGILLTIAAVAFTLVSWGHMGIGGRAAVLGAVTSLALAAPVLLLRRGLVSTAESVAALGLALTVLDAYAVHRVAAPDTDGLAYTAISSAALAALWAAYGLGFGRLRLPLPAALITAQLPLVLGALAAGAGPLTLTWALLATAAFDVAVALWGPGRVRPLACAGAWLTGGGALLSAGAMSLAADTSSDALRPGVLLLAITALALFAAWRTPARTPEPAAPAADEPPTPQTTTPSPENGPPAPHPTAPTPHEAPAPANHAPSPHAAAPTPHEAPSPRTGAPHPDSGAPAPHPTAPTPHEAPAPDSHAPSPHGSAPSQGAGWSSHAVASSVVAGLAVLAAVGGVLRPAVPGGWAVPVYVLCAVALLAVVRAGLPRAMALGLAGSSGAVLAAGALWALPPVAVSLLGPAAWVERAWSGAPAGVREALSSEAPWSWTAAAPLVLLTVAAVAVAAGRRPTAPGSAWRTPAACAALALAWAAAYATPAALGFGYPVAVTVYVLLTAAPLALAVRPSLTGAATAPGAPVALTALACALASAVSVSLLSLAAQAATLAVLGVLLPLFGAVAVLAKGSVTPQVAAVTAVVYATGLTGAVAASCELAPHQAALAVLAVPTAVAALAARIRGHITALPLEVAGAGAGLLAIGLAAGHAPVLALVLALCGVIAAGMAVRADRRPVGYAAAVFFVLATWVRLGASDVVTPEAYTLPVTVPALVTGVLRRRRDPAASSWTAYGPGLAATLLPSLVAAWGDQHWLRPLLLGAAALAVTLTGARHRLQAPLVLGSAALALVALHELAPYVVQVVGALPRWLPPAVAGLLLLAVGATYEQRLRDARRLRETLGRMR
ncbi:SCO7613 C-terminal domain-containing membrane protein [Streptomyces flavidovirens]|uniref:SCO7613 C-terminal domain-containing membrane protein n=1 Tax=Streptomyces flavidovirens TaxID=67298 RepID=UPI00368E9FE3